MKTAGILVAVFILLATGNPVRAEDGCIKSFQWDKIPGDDNSKLKDILKHHGFDWVDGAQINKIHGKIKVYTTNSILNIRLENGKVKFNDQEINGIKVKDYNDDPIIYDDSGCGTCNKNSFSWYKIPGDDDSKLKDFLNRHGYDWANSDNTNIVKNNDGSIRVFTDSQHSLYIRLYNNKVKINNRESNKIKFKQHENGDREIYYEGESSDFSDCGTCNKNSFSWYKIPGDDESKLKDFLNRHGYDWANSANVEKDKDKVKVTSHSGDKHISLELDDKEERLKIDEGTHSHYYKVKHHENDDREIYDDHETPDNSDCNNDHSIPEFPSIALPIGAVMAIMYIRRREN